MALVCGWIRILNYAVKRFIPKCPCKAWPFCIIELNKPWDQRHRRPSVEAATKSRAQRRRTLKTAGWRLCDGSVLLNSGQDSLIHRAFISLSHSSAFISETSVIFTEWRLWGHIKVLLNCTSFTPFNTKRNGKNQLKKQAPAVAAYSKLLTLECP